MALIRSPLDRVVSCLNTDPASFKRLILEAIGGKYGCTESEMIDFLSHSYLARLVPFEAIQHEVTATLLFLEKNNFILHSKSEQANPEEELQTPQEAANIRKDLISYSLTPFGEATYHSSFSAEESLIVLAELNHAREKGIILADELHLCYLMTPTFNLPKITDWSHYFIIFTKLCDIKQDIGERVGVSWTYLQRKSQGGTGKIKSKSEQEHQRIERATTRFYMALALSELIHECPVWDVSNKYLLPRGDLEQLMMSASSFAYMMVSFCQKMGWPSLACLLADYVKRLGFGVKEDVVPLIQIKGVGAARARALYNAGFRTVRAISSAKPEDLVRVVPNLGQFGERMAKIIIASAKNS